METMNISDQLALYLETGETDKFIGLLNQNPNIICHDGLTLLDKAGRCLRLECMKELMKYGIDINLPSRGIYPTLVSFINDYFGELLTNLECYHIIKFLIEAGSDCNYHFSNGKDLLQFFCWFSLNHYDCSYLRDILGLLLDYGADRGYVYEGHTAESYLRDGHMDELADFIRDYEVVPGMKGVYDG